MKLCKKKHKTKFWKRCNPFSDNQFGFGEKHSTTLAITCLYERLLLYKNNDDEACGIFLDIAKAFDSVDHKTIKHRLEYYGVRKGAIKLLIFTLQIQNNMFQ